MEIIKNNKINLFQNCSINSGSSAPRTLHHGYSTLEDLDVMAMSKDKMNEQNKILNVKKVFFFWVCAWSPNLNLHPHSQVLPEIKT